MGAQRWQAVAEAIETIKGAHLGQQVQGTAVFLLAILITASQCTAQALCASELDKFSSALISIENDYLSRDGVSSLGEIELFAYAFLPSRITPECISVIERTYPRQTLRVSPAGGEGIMFYEENDSFELGFHISGSGVISGIFAKGK